jgi:hypothetical protein
VNVVRSILGRLLAVFSSLKTSCVLIAFLGLLTWLGTLEQTNTGLYEVQKKYFESLVLVHHVGSVPIPLPGVYLLMALLFVNLVVGGLVRLRKGWQTAGVLVAHIGIAMMIISAFQTFRYAESGHVTLFEGQHADRFESYFRWEIVLSEDLGNGKVAEHVIPDESIVEARSKVVHVTSKDLPFAIDIDGSWQNCRPEWVTAPRSGETSTQGVRLAARPANAQAEANIAGVSVAIVDDANHMRREALLWGAESQPYTFVASGRAWTMSLHKERYPMPFAIALEKFTKEDHPRSNMPKSFASDVKVTEAGTTRDVRISMNQPLREGGLVVYQASWGPADSAPGQPLFSTFAVVRNPSDHGPLYACIVIALGLVFHFSRKLLRFVRLEARTA